MAPRVLVADDHSVTRRVLEMLLARWGMAPHVVAGGRAAVAAVDDARARGESFALVILDTDMPDMDGLAVAADLNRRGVHQSDKIVMLTSGTRPGDDAIIAALRVGASLAKPIIPAELRHAIGQCLGTGIAGEDEPGPSGTVPVVTRQCHVLLADDSGVTRMLISRLLERVGHTVVVAHNGREAVSAFERARFDVVLMDLEMPEMDGIQAALAIRAAEAGRGTRVPIVAMTARAHGDERVTCHAAGIDVLLTKPVRAAEFHQAIRRVVGDDASPLADADPAAMPDAETAAEPRIDWVKAWDVVGRDTELLHGLVAGLRAQMPSRIAALSATLDTGNLVRAAEIAGPLAEALAEFGAARAAAYARRVGTRSAEGDPEATRVAVGQLVSELEWLARALVGGDRSPAVALARGRFARPD